MNDFTINETGDLNIIPSETSSQHDFDFYVGKWKIHNRKLNRRLDNCNEWSEFEALQEMELILQGRGNRDNFLTTIDGEPFEGMSLRLFDPMTRLWSMYWADSGTGVLQPPTVSSFYGDIGRFYCNDMFNGQKIIVQFKWDRSDLDNPVWSQALRDTFSTCGHCSWVWWCSFVGKVRRSVWSSRGTAPSP